MPTSVSGKQFSNVSLDNLLSWLNDNRFMKGTINKQVHSDDSQHVPFVVCRLQDVLPGAEINFLCLCLRTAMCILKPHFWTIRQLSIAFTHKYCKYDTPWINEKKFFSGTLVKGKGGALNAQIHSQHFFKKKTQFPLLYIWY